MTATNQSVQDDTLEDMLEYLVPRGFPTFDEFKKDPDKYRLRADHLFESADGSTRSFRKQLVTQRYFWKDQYDCGSSLEKVERIAKEEGYGIHQLEMCPKVRSMTGTSKETVETVVQFWPKAEFKAMGGVVANDG